MTNNKTVLVSGASIAGPALAFWLNKFGFKVTIVERAPTQRLGGQNIDISGAGRMIVQKMGIEQKIIAASTGELGVNFVDENNTTQASLEATGNKSKYGTIEILRGELAEILYDETRQNVTYIFGNYITDLQEQAENVKVSFKNGEEKLFDIVIAADGIRSGTRTIMFGDLDIIKPLGLCIAYFTIPKGKTDTNWARWYNAPNSRAIFIRPDNVGTTRVSFSFITPPIGYEKKSIQEKKEILRNKYYDAGWEVDRILEGLNNATEVDIDSISQIKSPVWHKGRLSMTGDAAYCPSPLTGMGATLSIIGAYVLAGELATNENHTNAFIACEKLMKPYVKTIQQLPPFVPQGAHPKGKAGLFLMHTVLKIISSKFVKMLSKLFNSGDKSGFADDIKLPDYDLLVSNLR